MSALMRAGAAAASRPAEQSEELLWTPENLTTELWLDAQDEATITIATGVSQWADKSGNGHNFTQGTAANQPAYAPTGLNGKPAVQLDGVNDHLLNTGSSARSIFTNVNQGWCLSIVKRAAATSKQCSILQSRTASGSGRFATYSGAAIAGHETTANFVLRRLDADSAALLSADTDYGTDPVGLLFEADWATGQGRVHTNGDAAETAAMTSAGLTSNTESNTAVYLGSEGTSTFSDNGFGEVVAGNQALSALDVSRLFGYAMHRWGLEADLPASHDYKAGPPLIDEHSASVVSLLRPFGADASTTFFDEAGVTWTANGNAQIDTAQFKWTGAAALFDGAGDYISTPDSVDWHLSSGDFTIEGWVRFNGDPGTAQMWFASQWETTGNQRGWSFGISNNGLVLRYTTGGVTPIVSNQAWNPASATWYHVAVCRQGPDLRSFVGGAQVGSTFNIGTDSLFDSNDALIIGATKFAGGIVQEFNGWIGEFRLTKGVARYTESFTLPDRPQEVLLAA